LFLDAFTLRDIPEDALDAQGAALSVEERGFDHLHVSLAALGSEVCLDGLRRFAGFDDALIVALVFLGHVGREEIEVRLAEDFLAGLADLLAQPLVHEGEASGEVLAEHILR
jgi:hypothetical protein